MVNSQIRADLVRLLPRLRRFACGLTGSMDDGDDLVQSACERALARLDRFQPGTRLDSWMYRIMQNLWIDQCRARQARPEAGIEPVELEAVAVGDAERDLDSRLTMAAVPPRDGAVIARWRRIQLRSPAKGKRSQTRTGCVIALRLAAACACARAAGVSYRLIIALIAVRARGIGVAVGARV